MGLQTSVWLRGPYPSLALAAAVGLLCMTQRRRILSLPAKSATGISYGGTAIVIPFSSITLESGETNQETAIKRINSSQQKSASGRLISAYLSVDGKKRKLISAYAPARNARRRLQWDAQAGGSPPRRRDSSSTLGVTASRADRRKK